MKTGKDGPHNLLSTAVDNRLSWKLVNRACRHMEALSKGKITFFKNSNGVRAPAADTFSSWQAQPSNGDGSLSASSVGK